MQIRVRAQVTVEIMCGPYGSDWKIEDMVAQVKKEAPNRVRALITDKGCIAGEPKVILAITEFD